MTKSDYIHVLVKALVTLKLEGSNQLLDDILYALKRIPTVDETLALYLYENVRDYFIAVSDPKQPCNTQHLSNALECALNLSQYHFHSDGGQYENNISLSMYEETRNLVVWNNCEDSKDMLEETIIPGLSKGEVRVCYTLKDENIRFNYPIDEE